MATRSENRDIRWAAGDTRLYFMDNIRWLMIVFVVLMHLNVTYSTHGLWYYTEPSYTPLVSGLLFAIYGFFTQAYFMGLLFFIAGYFVPGSLDKKGTSQFIKNRLLRLGVPTLSYMLLIHPITLFIVGAFQHNNPSWLSWYIHYISSLEFLSSSGPLWFALALLVFSLVYALLRHISFFPPMPTYLKQAKSIKNSWVICVMAIMAIVAFLIRLVQPAGVPLFNTLTGNFMQIGFFSSYIILFAVGIIFKRCNLLNKLSYTFGKRWLILTLILGFPAWFGLIIGGNIVKNGAAFAGGFYWQAVASAIWESFFCVGVSLGIVAIFQHKYNTQGAVSKFLADNAFGVYVFHAPIVVAITMALREFSLNPLVKMYAVAILVLPVCFAFSYFLRKIVWIKRFFS